MDFSKRNNLEELMDNPDLSFEEMAGTLRGLGRVNRVLGGYGPSLDGLARLVGGQRSITVLDVGAGGGDTILAMTQWGRRKGIEVKIEGIDLSDAIVSYARQRTRKISNVEIRRANLFEIEGQEKFDIVHAALMLHHLSDEEVIHALVQMHRLARRGVVINDLHRHRLGYLASRMVLPAISRNRLVRHDGPVSILRAFQRQELVDFVRRARLPEPELRWWPFFRWQMILRK